MFNFLKKKCSICKMELKKGEHHPKGSGKEFCSEGCRETYRKKEIKATAKSGGAACH